MDTNTMSRDEKNRILKAHGYHWQKITRDMLDDNDDFQTEPGWYLYSSDNRNVSVTRAFAEIERGVAVVAAEERVAAEAEEAEQNRQQEMRRWRDRMAEIIRTQGTRPDGENRPEGKVVLDTSNIYGGGDWFAIGEDKIWYVRNNGMDGDNWSNNNVRTGGAGAIGWYGPMDTDIETVLLDLAADKVPQIKWF